MPGITKGLPAEEILRLMDISKKLPGRNAEAKKRVEQRKSGSGTPSKWCETAPQMIGENKLQKTELKVDSPVLVISESPAALQRGKEKAVSGKGGAAAWDAHSGSPTTDGGKKRRTVGTQMLHSPIHSLITRASKYTPLSWGDVSELSGGGDEDS